jgi:hypothetical protein
MTGVYGLYPDPDSAQRAVDQLRAAGIDEHAITVLSDAPMEHYAFGQRDKATWIWAIAALGGAIGLAFATWLARMTEEAWPLNTGGMPIVAWWPNLIIMFELTMLGAIAATVITLLYTGNLALRRRGLYDPEVTNGLILVGVENPSGASLSDLQRTLAAAGARSTRTV